VLEVIHAAGSVADTDLREIAEACKTFPGRRVPTIDELRA